MPVRLFLNIVYSILVKDADAEQREHIDAELYAPIDSGSAEAALANLLSNIGMYASDADAPEE